MTGVEVRPGRHGPVVACSDGLAGRWPDWLPLADALPEARVVAVLRDAVELDDAAAEVIAALDYFGAERAPVVGHSMGGFVAEAAARLHPDRISAIVLLDGSVTQVGRVMAGIDLVAGALIGATCARSPRLARGAAVVKRIFEPAEVRHDPERRRLVDPPGAQAESWEPVARELVAYQRWAERLDQIRATHPLPRIRVEVVTAARGPGRWLQRQGALVALLRAEQAEVTHRVVRSGHLVHLAKAEWAAGVVRRVL